MSSSTSKITKAQFIDKYCDDIKKIAGTLDVDFISCIYNSDSKTVDLYDCNLIDKPLFIQLVDYEDRIEILNNTLYYVVLNKESVKGKRIKLTSTYRIPVEELHSCIYDYDYYVNPVNSVFSLCKATKLAKDVLDKSDIKGLSKYGRLLDDNLDDNFLTHLKEELGDALKYIVHCEESFKQLCKKYPNDQELGQEFRRIYGGV